ncbi:MAG: hypothetical protein R2750_05930 [Bacteroidales bacterium]
MKTLGSILILAFFTTLTINSFCQDYSIYNGQKLADGLDMGVNLSQGQTHWLSDEGGYMKMTYPSKQSWGAVFITVGKPKNPPRPFKNFSGFKTLTVEMKGENGGENVDIGIKDNTDPDNGQESKITKELTQDWEVYEFSLSDFKTADLSHLYVIVEFVFGGSSGRTVYFRNIKYIK